MKTKSFAFWLAALLIPGTAWTSDTHQVVDAPGFRPQSERANTFLDQVASSRVAVLPSVIRTRTGTFVTEEPQDTVVGFLNTHALGQPEACPATLDMGELSGNSQFEWFQGDQQRLGALVRTNACADYHVMIEFLVPKGPSGNISMFGIHVYVLDADGENAFSFLLNSHHKMFAEASLESADASEEGCKALALKATPVALEALRQQVTQARQEQSE
jgi:hypothetical protein